MHATIKHLYISPDHNYFGRYGKDSLKHPIVERASLELVAGSGIVGDRFFNYETDYKGQITFFDSATYEKVISKFKIKDLKPSVFRRNVVVDGIDLNSLIGKRFSFNGMEFTGSCGCKPCFWMNEAIADGAEDFLKGRGGLRARIQRGGTLVTGATDVEILGDVTDVV
ncbi:MAG: MOSC domain-containing protein [Rubritalea sp.]|uniref:MOSC domain-containing protein n=1 Tax=Rubritalea sp. TaxID=2109375 RepID=UPI0032426EBA